MNNGLAKLSSFTMINIYTSLHIAKKYFGIIYVSIYKFGKLLDHENNFNRDSQQVKSMLSANWIYF